MERLFSSAVARETGTHSSDTAVPMISDAQASLHPAQPGPDPRRHPLAVPALAIALVGVPFFGIVVGPVAVILAGTALSHIAVNPLMRGRGIAMAALIIGVMDLLLWGAALAFIMARPAALSDAEIRGPVFPTEQTLAQAPEPIRRALKANVFLSVAPSGPSMFRLRETQNGSGVVVASNAHGALIVTSRHLVDASFGQASGRKSGGGDTITAYFSDGTQGFARVVWRAPYEIDAALVAVGDVSRLPRPSAPAPNSGVGIGAKVFTVGNPHDYTWSYTEGVISGIREKRQGPVAISVYQTQAPVNPGSSGGGLYLADGTLVGIVVWTKHKAQAEGMSFAVGFRDVMNLYRPRGAPVGGAESRGRS